MVTSRKQISIFILILITNLSCAQRKSKYYTISGIVTSTSSYCGGAAPSDEMLTELSKPRPINGKLLFIKSGKENSNSSAIVKSLTTDSLGRFEIKLQNGSYCIVEEYKSKEFQMAKNDKNSTWDENCLRDEYAKCDYQINVTDKNITDVKINFPIPCNWSKPCLQYNGPLPPSAAPRGRN